jgi:hypothetical protein
MMPRTLFLGMTNSLVARVVVGNAIVLVVLIGHDHSRFVGEFGGNESLENFAAWRPLGTDLQANVAVALQCSVNGVL